MLAAIRLNSPPCVDAVRCLTQFAVRGSTRSDFVARDSTQLAARHSSQFAVRRGPRLPPAIQISSLSYQLAFPRSALLRAVRSSVLAATRLNSPPCAESQIKPAECFADLCHRPQLPLIPMPAAIHNLPKSTSQRKEPNRAESASSSKRQLLQHKLFISGLFTGLHERWLV